MYEIRKTKIFEKWLCSLRDRRAKARIDRVKFGNFGDVSPVGEGVSEMRIFYGPGYRVYFIQQGKDIVILLSDGDKSSQPKDILQAKEIAKQIEESL
ncbi:MAG: type II toxin-antitoxin system RelE/ParE family toxin [Enterobacterales bacterium]|nr:type II toxin-antitoxin system RelE/ParE family toxin [Enterobacterales bacterium]